MDFGKHVFIKLLRDGNYRKLLVAQTVSGLGDWVATFGFIALIYDLTGNTNYVAWILIVRLVPPMLAAPLGGLLADRLPRRPIMVSLDLSRAVLIALVPFVNVWLVFVIAFAHEFMALFYYPARDAAIPDIASKKHLPAANGLILAAAYGSLPVAGAVFSAIHNSSSLVPRGFPLHHLINQRPVTLVFFLDSLSFLISAGLIFWMTIPYKPAKRAAKSLKGQLGEGVSYVWNNPRLRLLCLGILMAMFGAGVLFAVGIAYVHKTLGGSDATFGWLASLWGAGMGIGLLFVRKLISWRGAPYSFVASVAVCGGILIAMSLVAKIYLAFAFAVPFGMAYALSITLATSMAQAAAADNMRGRAMGAFQTLFRLGLAAGALIMGAVAHQINGVKIIIFLDSNQFSMFISGLLILASAVIASRMLALPKTAGQPALQEK